MQVLSGVGYLLQMLIDILRKYLFWLLALSLAMLPVVFTVAPLPNQVGRLSLLESYDSKELILFCMTVEVVALLDALEVFTKRKQGRNKNFEWVRLASTLLLFCVIPKLILFSYWFAKLQELPHQTAQQLLTTNVGIGVLLVAAVVCAFGCRTAHILAELTS